MADNTVTGIPATQRRSPTQGVSGDMTLWMPTPDQGSARLVTDAQTAALLGALLGAPDPVTVARQAQASGLDDVDRTLDPVGPDFKARYNAATVAHQQRVETALKNADLSDDGKQRAKDASIATWVADLRAAATAADAALRTEERTRSATGPLDEFPDDATHDVMLKLMGLGTEDLVAFWRRALAVAPNRDGVREPENVTLLSGFYWFVRSLAPTDGRFTAMRGTVTKLLDDTATVLMTPAVVAFRYTQARAAMIRLGVGTILREAVKTGTLDGAWWATVGPYFAAPLDRMAWANVNRLANFELGANGQIVYNGDLGGAAGPSSVMG